MTRRWFVVLVAVVVNSSCISLARGQSSLADRIQQFRRDFGGASAAPQAAEPQAAQPPRAPGLLPQIDARSLLPSGLFGRSDEDSDDRESANATPSRFGRDFSSQEQAISPRAASRSPQADSYRVPIDANRSVGDSFTLPGLSRPTATASRPNDRPSSRSVTPITPIPDDDRPQSGTPQIALRPRTDSSRKPLSTVRRSPTNRHVEDFDPEALRNELAGTFTGPAKDAEPARTRSAEVPITPIGSEPIPLRTQAGRENTAPVPERTPDLADESDLSFSAIEEYVKETQRQGGGDSATKDVRPVPHTATQRAAESSADAARAFQPSESSGSSITGSTNSELFSAPTLRGDQSSSASRDSFVEHQPPASPNTVVLVENQAPIITSDIRGPQQIMIGREATYRIRLQNQGSVAAEELVANIQIPSWAEVVDASSAQGVIRHAEGTESAGAIEWQLPRLDAQGSCTLQVRLIPRSSRPLELSISWTHTAVASRAVVEVQEPKLEMHVTGPEDVLYGNSYVYRLHLANPGTGTAEDVRIDLLPPGGGERAATNHRLGDLAPGATKDIELELTPREAGKLSVQAVATAAGGLKSEAGMELFCRKPELTLDWRGPEMQYAGTTATYFLRVRNPGTASADEVTVRTKLPPGAVFVGASEGHRIDAASGEVAWRVGSLGPGDDCYMELRCQVNTPGENRIQVTAATAAGELTDSAIASTNVVALADLTLQVSDPAGPVLVGDDAIYEIRVENRGASAAEDVNVVALFSSGLEPEAAEGASYDVADGRVTFRTIRQLPAGQHSMLRIRAKALQAGTHVFRAEVLCRDLEIKLAAEETTRFYSNDSGHDPASNAPISIGDRYEESVR